mmetsp:Transcript_4225/g.8581  ORF Transcript_4225/g.8581 Transcript_4225/m.8581 type:complete len:2196 (-) Transcript_4225:58-6645(-)
MPSLLHVPRLVLMAALGANIVGASIMEDGFGYKATTDVSAILNLALDIQQMRIAKDDFVKKKQLYEDGQQGGFSLQKLALDAASKYGTSPYYNIYRAGFELLGTEEEGDDPLQFDGESVDTYADTVVQDLFLLDVTHIEAEAALAMNVAMAYLGSLWTVLESCKTDDRAGMNKALDEAAAFWVGAGQVKGDGQTGYLLYNAAQFAGAKFNQDQGDSEVSVNESVLAALGSMQSDIASGVCATQDGYKVIRREVKNLVGHLNRVLVQMMIHRVQTVTPGVDSDFVELYALALLPQISSCNPDVYYRLIDLTIDNNVNQASQQDVVVALQSVYSCLHITCADVGAYQGSRVPACNDNPTPLPMVAGYQPQNDVRKFSALDRDIRQIRWMMKFGAFNAAEDWYEYGWNGIIPFGNIARNNFLALIDTTEDFKAIASYYDDEESTFDSIIKQIFQGVSPFDVTTTDQRTSMIDGFLKGPLMYLATTAVIEEALFTCQSGDTENTIKHWDEAVAFFVGSTEGTEAGGAKTGPGDSIWGLGDMLCEYFSNCEPNDAQVNERLMDDFTGAAGALGNGGCDQISSIYSENIRPNLLVAMIQGTIYNYVEWFRGNVEESGYVYGLSRILLPLFSKGMTGDKSVLQDLDRVTDFGISRIQPGSDDVESLFSYLTTVLQTFPLDCATIGAIRADTTGPHRQVCPAGTPISPPPIPAPPTTMAVPTLAPSPEIVTPTRAPGGSKDVPPVDPRGLAWGRYNFVDESWANNDARFSRAIKTIWTTTDSAAATTAYQAQTVTLSGVPSMNSLAALSTEAQRVMGDDLMHNFYLYALYDDVDFDSNLSGEVDPWPYGDEVVTLGLDPTHGDSSKLAAEAAIVMNIWMAIVHQLYESSRECKNGSDAPKYIDSAVGLWIGEEQGNGLFNTGWSIYSIAQEAYKLYGNEEFESPVNEALMDAFSRAQQTARTCTGDRESAYAVLRVQVDEIIHDLSLPLLQMLLYYLSVQDKNYIELFSLAFIPQVITCNIDEFGDLSNRLFQASVLNESDDKKIALLENLAAGLSCLRYNCDDLGDTSNASESLQIIVRDLCEDLENDFGTGNLAGYQVSDSAEQNRDIDELSRLDLDLLQIEILMRANAVLNAQEIFEYGRNSRTTNFYESYQLMSLKSLSNDPVRQKAGDVYDAYEALYGDDFGGSIVTKVFDGSLYSAASRLEKAEAVVRAIQTSVTYVNIVGRLREAVEVCKSGEPAGGDEMLANQAAALFVGSIEGSKSGGSPTNSGGMLMALGKEVCQDFGTCATQGDSTANEFIMFAFSDLKEWFGTNDCSSAEQILEESLLPMLPISMIQSTIKLAYTAAAQDGARTALDVVAQSIIPLVGAANQTSASALTQNTGYSRTPDGNAVVNAIAFSLRGMGVDCNAIGTYASSNVKICRSPEEVPPAVETPTDLGGGKYTSTTYVQDRADISKDVEQMRDALGINNLNLATEIYTDGENSPIYNAAGTTIGARSLKKFSTEAQQTMTSNPIYQASVLALRDNNGQYLGAPVWQFADSIVQESFGKGGALAVDAAVALNLWMEATNELFTMVTNCKKRLVKDDDGVHSIDEAAAYWLGDAKTDGQIENGHLLYALAEDMAVKFDTVSGGGQARANSNLLRILQAAKLELSYASACSEDVTTARRVRHLVNQAVSQMMVPMVQALLDAIITSNKDRVRIYAHAVVPRLVTCNPSAYEYLKEKLIVGSYVAREEDEIALKLQSVYSCLGITCEDVGFHQDSELDVDCDDEEIAALSGFRTRTDAGEYAKLDLDIQELDVLMAMEAYEAAEELYMFGHHALTGLDEGRVSLSLQSLATNTGRSSVPEYVAFEEYFGNDGNYADSIMKQTFDESTSASPVQRRYVAVGTAQYMIMYMAALQEMQQAINACERDSADLGASEHWDRAAAYLIGYLEGPGAAAGTDEGRLVWGLAKSVCNEWGTCSATVAGNAVANEKILSLLYSGRGALTSGRSNACPGLKNAVSELQTVLRGPLIQGAISAVVRTFESPGGVNKEMEHAKAHALANAILPLIAVRNRNAASTIRTNLDFDGEPLSSGLTEVVDSFTNSLNGLGVNCGDVGVSETVDACTGQVKERSNTLLIIIIIVLTCATLGIAILAYQKRRNNKTKDAPVFVPNEKGEMSHSEVIGNGSSARSDAQDIMHNDADAAADDDFEHAELPETV